MRTCKWLGAALGTVALLVRLAASQFAEVTEKIYSRTFFPAIRQLFDMSLSKLPFPSVYIFGVAVVGVVLFVVFQTKKMKGAKSKSSYLLRSILNFTGLLVFLFLLVWGYNYQRLPVYRQLSLTPLPLSGYKLESELTFTHRALVDLRAQLTSDTLAI